MSEGAALAIRVLTVICVSTNHSGQTESDIPIKYLPVKKELNVCYYISHDVKESEILMPTISDPYKVNWCM